MDTRVEIYGTSRAAINGNRGVATKFNYVEDKSKSADAFKPDGQRDS